MLLKALKAKYNAKKAVAEANLQVLLTSSTGIGEHSDIVSECDQWIQEIAEAEDAIAVLERFYNAGH